MDKKDIADLINILQNDQKILDIERGYKYSQSFREQKNANTVQLAVTKELMLSPQFAQLLQSEEIVNLSKYKTLCFNFNDSELYFNEAEAEILLKDYDLIQKLNGELFFVENIGRGNSYSEYIKKPSKFFRYNDASGYIYRTPPEVLNVNQKLIMIANKINSGFKDKSGQVKQLSPMEKFCLCFEIVNNIPYHLEEDSGLLDQSLIEIVKNNKGCCVGKSQYLKALLNLVGINSCCIACFDLNNNVQGVEALKKLGIFAISDFRKERKELLKRKPQYKFLPNHQCNLISLIDEKYDIDGVFATDATNGAPIIEFEPDKLFNFGSYYEAAIKSNGVEKFLLQAKNKPGVEKLTEKQEKQLEEKYFTQAKGMIISDFIDYITEHEEDYDKLPKELKKAITKFNEGDSYQDCQNALKKPPFNNFKSLRSIKKYFNENLYDLTNSSHNLFIKLYNDWLDYPNEHLRRVIEGVRTQIAFKNLQPARIMSKENFQKLTNTVYAIYSEHFCAHTSERTF